MIVLEFDRGKRYRATEKGVLAFRVTAQDPAVAVVTLRLRWDDGSPERSARVVPSAIAASRSAEIAWLPAIAGEDVIRIEGEVSDGRRCVATFSITLTVHVQAASPSSSQVNYTFQGDRVRVTGVDMRATLGAAPEAGRHPAFADWRELDLEWNHRPAVRTNDGVPAATSATVTIETANGERRVVGIASRSEMRCGRHSSNDVALRFMPESDEQNSRSEILSKFQFVLSVEEGIVLAGPGGGSSPTFVDGKRMGGSHMALAPSGARVTAGLMGLELGVDLPPDAVLAASVTHAEIANLLGVTVTDSGPPSVRLRRVNNATELSYLWLRQWATIGSAHDCAIRLPQLPAPYAARLYFVAGRYFIQPLADALPLTLAGVVVETGAICQLGNRVAAQLGSVSLDWSLGG